MSDFHVQVSSGATLNATVGETEYDLAAKEKTATDGEFERFESFAANLIQVPKAEIDAQRDN